MIKLDDMINRFLEYGLEVVNYQKVSANLPVKCKDKLGYLASIKYSTLRGTSPYIFSVFDKRNPYVIENINKFIKDNDINITLMSTSFDGGGSPLSWKCSCGEIFVCSLDAVRYSNKISCNTCSFKNRADLGRFTNEDASKQAMDFGMRIIDSYTGALTPMLVMDEKGYIGDITLANIKFGKKFSIFSPKYIYENIRNYIKIKNYNLELIYVYPFLNRRDRARIKCRCECGNIFEMGMESLLGFDKSRCNECTKKMSRYECVVKRNIDKLGYKYISQKRFYEYDFQKYSFDFYIEEINTIIEVDGEGHFFPVRFNGISQEEAEENFKQYKIRDALKNNFCSINHIKLIRISYLQIFSGEYIKIISNITCEK